MPEDLFPAKITRRALGRSLLAAGTLLATTVRADEPPPPKPDEAEADRLVTQIDAQVAGGLTNAEKARVRAQVRGTSDFLAPLRRAPLPEGAEPSSTWTPFLGQG